MKVSPIRITLIADGSSDRTLLEVIKWVIDKNFPSTVIQPKLADFRNLSKPPKLGNVQEQIKFAEKYYPFDLLIYHRDAESKEKGIITIRKSEILSQVLDANLNIVCMVPIVMMETWLLIDSLAIKKAAGNRNSKEQIILPTSKQLEKERDPKNKLHDILRQASGLRGRNIKTFNVHMAVHLVAENIQDFSSLRQLSSFKEFEKDLVLGINKLV